MKKINFLLVIILIVIVASCKDNDDNYNVESGKYNISGRWEFILSPDVTVPDTTVSHGYTGNDFEEYAATNDEVYLYADTDGKLKGFSGPFKFMGNIENTKVTLSVYINPDGDYNPVLPLEEMQLFSKMELVFDEYGFMSGNGKYEPYADYPNIVNNTYFVNARKLSSVNILKNNDTGYKSSVEINSWEGKICKEVDKMVNWVLNDLTDGKLRPMNDCSLHHDGGGYYLLGHEGPGDYDIFSTTIYYPYQLCTCGSRTYDFNISLKGEHISISDLIEKIKSSSIEELAKKLGFDIPDDLIFALEEFHNEFGGFALSIGYSEKTHNLSIYVNHEKGSSSDAKNHPMIQKIKSEFAKHVHDVLVIAGHSVHDEWYLSRTWDTECNTPVIYTYLLGTNDVNFN